MKKILVTIASYVRRGLFVLFFCCWTLADLSFAISFDKTENSDIWIFVFFKQRAMIDSYWRPAQFIA